MFSIMMGIGSWSKSSSCWKNRFSSWMWRSSSLRIFTL